MASIASGKFTATNEINWVWDSVEGPQLIRVVNDETAPSTQVLNVTYAKGGPATQQATKLGPGDSIVVETKTMKLQASGTGTCQASWELLAPEHRLYPLISQQQPKP
jgi:hypothetical protein